MLKQRVLSALLIAPIFAWVTLAGNDWVYALFWMMLTALAAREWGRLLEFPPAKYWLYALVVVVCSLLASYGANLADTQKGAGYLGALILIFVSASIWLIVVPWLLHGFSQSGQLRVETPILAGLGIIFLASFSAAMIFCREALEGAGLLGLFVLIWSTDIGAYFVGRQFGKTPFVPSISPKKTREGFLGGWGLGMLLALIYWFLFARDLPFFLFIGVTAIALVYASIGDLWESVLKRRVGKKDSGTILPGHGGVLDRIDSWLPAMVIWAVGLSILSYC